MSKRKADDVVDNLAKRMALSVEMRGVELTELLTLLREILKNQQVILNAIKLRDCTYIN